MQGVSHCQGGTDNCYTHYQFPRLKEGADQFEQINIILLHRGTGFDHDVFGCRFLVIVHIFLTLPPLAARVIPKPIN